jgi:glutathione S-transferase
MEYQTMKLFGSYTSPFVRHCRIVLLETEADCDFIEADINASALQSPTKRVPYLQDDDIFLTDSNSIIKYLREKSGRSFCTTAKELDTFCLVNTLMETTVNLFFLKRDGVDIEAIPYLQRQSDRVQSTLYELNQTLFPGNVPYNDIKIRLACFMSWAKFRQLLDFSKFQNLEGIYQEAMDYSNFSVTQPPQA